MTWFRQRQSTTAPTLWFRVGLAALAALAVLAVLLAGLTGSAGAVSALTAPQGGSVAISGTVSPSPSCPANAPVQLTSTPASGQTNLFPNGMGPQVPRDANGNFQTTLTIPATTPVGSYTIGVRCGGTNAGAVQVLNVTAAPAKPTITVTPATAHQGDSITISGTAPTAGTPACPAGDVVQATATASLFPPNGFGPQLTRDAAGNFHGTYTIPKTTAPGSYSIGLRCGGGNLGVSAPLQVMAAAATTTTTPTSTTTTTTTTIPPTTAASTSTIPATSTTRPTVATTAPPTKAKSSSNRRTVRWVALAALVALLLATAALLSSRRGGRVPPGAAPPPPGPPPPPPPTPPAPPRA